MRHIRTFRDRNVRHEDLELRGDALVGAASAGTFATPVLRTCVPPPISARRSAAIRAARAADLEWPTLTESNRAVGTCQQTIERCLINVASRRRGRCGVYRVMVILQQPNSVPSVLRPPHFIEAKRGIGMQVRGYVLKQSNLIVLRRFEGFSPRGLSVVNRTDVSELLINEKWTQMIREEGHAHLAEEHFGLPTTSMRELAAALFERGRNIWIECAQETSAEYGLYVGRIVALASAHLDVTTFDSDGHWLLGSYSIPYSSITRIEIDDPYVDTFSKYINECPIVSPEA